MKIGNAEPTRETASIDRLSALQSLACELSAQ
jgi:hypothetical protein